MSVTLEFGDPKNLPSSEAAADAAVWAIDQGDYRIARALTTLAVELADLEADNRLQRDLANVPMLGVTRDEQPRTPLRDVSGPTGNGDADLRAIREAAAGDTEVIRISHAPNSCSVCGTVITWHVDQIDVTDNPIGPRETVGGAAYWTHAAEQLNADHPAMPATSGDLRRRPGTH